MRGFFLIPIIWAAIFTGICTGICTTWGARAQAEPVKEITNEISHVKPMAKPKFVKSIAFKQGSSKIADLKALERFAGWLRVKTDVTDIRLEGFHCDADRKKEGVVADEMLDYLLFIARERAEAVRAGLIARGMEGRKFEIVALGMADDPATCKVTAMALEPEKKPEVKLETKLESKPALKVSGELGKTPVSAKDKGR